MGTTAPEARVTLVVDASTGAPVALTDLRGTIEVMTIVARGPFRPASESARMELVVDGPRDTTLALDFDAPAPRVAAHKFALDLSRRFPPGAYTFMARLIIGGNLLASSPPIYVVVGRQ